MANPVSTKEGRIKEMLKKIRLRLIIIQAKPTNAFRCRKRQK